MNDRERQALFGRARREASPTDDDRQRVRAALSRKLGVAAVASIGVAATKAAASVTEVGVSSLAIVKAAGAVVVAIAAVGLVALPARHGASSRASAGVAAAPVSMPAPRVAPAHVASPAVSATPEPLPVREETAHAPPSSELPRPPDRETAPREPIARSVSAPAVASDDANEEVALVKEMQIALRDGDAPRVLALVQDHERRFPSSMWAPERDGARALARCAGAAPSEAETIGQAFLDSHPLSPLAARVRSACGLRAPAR